MLGRFWSIAGDDANDGVEGGFGAVVAIEKQRVTIGAPAYCVIHTPECDHFNGFFVFHKDSEEVRVLVGQFLVGINHRAALWSRVGG